MIHFFLQFHLQSDLLNMTIYDLAYEEDHSELYNLLSNPSVVIDPMRADLSKVNQICFSCHLKRGGVDYREDVSFELVQFVGYFRKCSFSDAGREWAITNCIILHWLTGSDIDIDDLAPSTSNNRYVSDTDSKYFFFPFNHSLIFFDRRSLAPAFIRIGFFSSDYYLLAQLEFKRRN